jgi:hypothetical protein
LNDPFSSDQASALAGVSRADHQHPCLKSNSRAYRLVFGRPPTSEEVSIGQELLQARPGRAVGTLLPALALRERICLRGLRVMTTKA